MEFCHKVQGIVDWSPASYFYSIPHNRINIFGHFQRKILYQNLQYLYVTVTLVSLSVLLSHIAAVDLYLDDYTLNEIIVDSLLGLLIISYHCFLLFVLKVDSFKKRFYKILPILNVISYLLLRASVEKFAVQLSVGEVNVIIEVLDSGIITFYFQNSFALSFFFWSVSMGFSLISLKDDFINTTANSNSVVCIMPSTITHASTRSIHIIACMHSMCVLMQDECLYFCMWLHVVACVCMWLHVAACGCICMHNYYYDAIHICNSSMPLFMNPLVTGAVAFIKYNLQDC